MATMIPTTPREFSEWSLEGIMFDALNQLPEEYYVFHSFTIVNKGENFLNESEADFVVFNQRLGILVIEAKAGQISYSGGEWIYGDGKIMKHGGPYRQARRSMYEMMEYIRDRNLQWLLYNCKFLYTAWFPSITRRQLESGPYPADVQNLIPYTLTKDSFDNIVEEIETVFAFQVPSGTTTLLSNSDFDVLLKKVLCPKFNIIPDVTFIDDIHKERMNKLLNEQVRLLDYLEEQKSAVINGMAGTGKTMLAVEKARRLAGKGEKVLFLCYNRLLKEKLSASYQINGVDFFTIDGFTCRICATTSPNYDAMKECLLEMFYNDSFGYDHVIIDEGQDFGKEQLEEVEIIELISSIIEERGNQEGSFYIFYDKNQMVQSQAVPKYISEADCKLTLYTNCRNSMNISTTATRPLPPMPKKSKVLGIQGGLARFFNSSNPNDIFKAIDEAISDRMKRGIKDIVILTCKTEETSVLRDKVNDGKYGKQSILFSTCRKFKGLEADAVILVDITSNTFLGENKLIFYVGASRARLHLSLFFSGDEPDCIQALEYLEVSWRRNPAKALATKLNSRTPTTKEN